MAHPSPVNFTSAAGKFADARQGEIRARVGGGDARIERVMALARKDRRDACTPRALHRRQDAQLVIHHHVVRSRVTLLHGGQHFLLVQVDEHAPLHGIPQSGALHLAWLEHHVAVGEDHSDAKTATALQRRQRARVQSLRERIVEQEERDLQQLRLIEIFEPIALQRAQIIRVAELCPQFLEDHPVALAAGMAEFALQVLTEIGLHGIVVEQRVVDIEQEDGVGGD